MIVSIPYKSHNNKIIFDLFTIINKQLNNINMAKNLTDNEANFKNHVFIMYNVNTLYMYSALSQRCGDSEEFISTAFYLCELQDLEIKNIDNTYNKILYLFDIDKFNSTLSFSLDYKDRDKICLYFDNSKIYYKVSDKINIELGSIVNSEDIINTVDTNITNNIDLDLSDAIEALSVDNVDKNSPLLPFFNYKDCLNFTVSSTDNIASICKDSKDNYYFNNYLYKDNKVQFEANTLLRKDKFTINKFDFSTNNYMFIPPSFWQTLIFLYSNRVWKNLTMYYNYYAHIVYNDNLRILVKYDITNQLEQNTSDYFINYCDENAIQIEDNYELVGKLHSNELFMINKFYSNASRNCCYFDFSKQEFVGNGYIYSDNKDEFVSLKLENSDNISSNLPLKLTFAEIKHYIGSDLSQKNFILYIYTDGMNVKFEKYNANTNILENCVKFNYILAKSAINK